jgi:hypothetical protein
VVIGGRLNAAPPDAAAKPDSSGAAFRRLAAGAFSAFSHECFNWIEQRFPRSCRCVEEH